MKIGDRHTTGFLVVACLALIAHATTAPTSNTQAQLDNYLSGIALADLEQRSAEQLANTCSGSCNAGHDLISLLARHGYRDRVSVLANYFCLTIVD